MFDPVARIETPYYFFREREQPRTSDKGGPGLRYGDTRIKTKEKTLTGYRIIG
jgi:hypothetical protein